ncbi:eukaryotic translation initiation factor 2-alpha kinase, partial [Coemansia nantahalensis]
MDGNTGELQRNEVAVLQAIFADDYRDVVARTAWNVKQAAPEFAIRVSPTNSELRDRVSVELHVRLPRAYPRVAPQLALEDGRGLSDAQLAAAQAMVRQQAEALVGSEMVYELAVALGEHLTAHNSAAQAAQPSFHQQMVDRERAGREADQERAAEQRREQQRADAEEQQALQTRIRAELERKQQQQAQSDEQHRRHLGAVAEAVHSVAGRWAEGIQLLRFARPVVLDPQAAHRGWFSTVALEEADGSSDPLCTVFDAYPTDLEGASMHLADRFTAQCFTVTARHYLAEPGSRQIERVRARVAELAQIRHDNLVTVYGAHVDVQREHSSSPALCLWVLSDALLSAGESTLEDVLASCGAIAARQTGIYLRHILLGLVSLHAAGFVHCGVMPSNVLVVKEARGRFAARLFNTCYREELLALHRATPLSTAIGDTVGTDIRVAPEVVDRPDMMGRKNDIWCAGVVGLQMALGTDALRGVPIGGEPQVLAAHRRAMPPALFGVLARMLTVDHRARPTAIEALDSPLFHEGADVRRQALVSASRGLAIGPLRVEGERPQRASRVERMLQPSASRYRTDFEEVGFLGKGGFGSVVKARNRIDGRFYAIKKIPLDPRDSDGNRKIFREVTTLSRLHHHNVVRYYTTWVENMDAVDYASDSDGGLDDPSVSDGGIGAYLSHSS